MNKKTIALALSSVLAVSSFAVLSGTTGVKAAEKQKMTIWIWGGASDKPTYDVFKEAVAAFNKSNKYNVTFDATVTENEAYKTKIATAMASNTLPDVFETWVAGKLKEFVDAGKVVDLSSSLNGDAAWKKTFPSSIFDSLKFDNKIYAIPNTHFITPLFYNKAIFKKYNLAVPKTYADLKNVIKVLNKNNVTPIALGEKDAWTGAIMSEVVMDRVGAGQAIKEVQSGKGKWTNPAFAQGGKVMQELVKLNAFPKGFMALSYDNANAMFKRGEAAMTVMGTWVGGMFCAPDSSVKNSVGVAKFPSLGKGSTDAWIGAPDNCFAVSSASKNKQAAIALLKTITQSKYQVELAENAGSMPATSVKVNPKKANDVMIDAMNLEKTMVSMFPAYDTALGSDYGNEFNNTIQSILGGTDPKKAFAELQKYADSQKK